MTAFWVSSAMILKGRPFALALPAPAPAEDNADAAVLFVLVSLAALLSPAPALLASFREADSKVEVAPALLID